MNLFVLHPLCRTLISFIACHPTVSVYSLQVNTFYSFHMLSSNNIKYIYRNGPMTMIKMDFQPKTKNKFIQSNTAFKLCYSWNLNISSILDSLLNKSTIRNTKINFFNHITTFTSLLLFAIIIIFVLSNNYNYFWIIKSLNLYCNSKFLIQKTVTILWIIFLTNFSLI